MTSRQRIARLQDGVSVVIPVYRSAAFLPEVVRRVCATMADRGGDFEVILVEDASNDDTWATAAGLAQDTTVRAVRLGGNVGQHGALLAGIRLARFAITVTIDDDLQHHPEDILLLLERMHETGADVIYGSSRDRAQPAFRRFMSSAVRRFLVSAMRVRTVEHLSPFRAFRTDLRRAFDGELGPSVTIDALLAWGTDAFDHVPVARHPREQGTSNYDLRRLARFALDTVIGYSARPLQFVTALGLTSALLGLVLLAYIMVRFVVSGTPVAGFPFLASTVSLFGGAQLLAIGVIGEYLARMHFRVMRRPTYHIAEVAGLSASESTDGWS
jgi:glycosyltransferase involved in cell wall biosynthesis